MKINGKNIKGVKNTVGTYNMIPVEKRDTVNIWFDNVFNTVMVVSNEIFEQSNMGTECVTDKLGFSYFRYDDVSECIKFEYPYLGTKNISMVMLCSVLSQYIV